MKNLRSEILGIQLRTITATPPDEIVVRIADVELLFKERTLSMLDEIERYQFTPKDWETRRDNLIPLKAVREQRELLKDE